MRYFPEYRLYRARKGISTDRALARMVGFSEQRISQWSCRKDRKLSKDEAEKLAAFLGCEATDIWDRETGRPIPAA
jgi:transcriptional regulator with XRE-family HTH domain